MNFYFNPMAFVDNLKYLGIGWLSIFIVIGVIMGIMKYIVYPVSEMLSQKASNIFELNIIPQTAFDATDRLHCIFIKDSSSA